MIIFNLQFTDACNPSPCNKKHEICKVNEDRTSHLCIPNGKYCGLLWYCFRIESAIFLTFTFFYPVFVRSSYNQKVITWSELTLPFRIVTWLDRSFKTLHLLVFNHGCFFPFLFKNTSSVFGNWAPLWAADDWVGGDVINIFDFYICLLYKSHSNWFSVFKISANIFFSGSTEK